MVVALGGGRDTVGGSAIAGIDFFLERLKDLHFFAIFPVGRGISKFSSLADTDHRTEAAASAHARTVLVRGIK